MDSFQRERGELSPTLERVATGARRRTVAEVNEDQAEREAAEQEFVEAATAAVAAREPVSAIAEAEQIGVARARGELGRDVIRGVSRAARAKRESEAAYEKAIRRAGRLGLSNRDIAGAADVSHTTIRTLLSRDEPKGNGPAPSETEEEFVT